MWPPSVQVQAAEQYEQEFQAFQSGKYKESAQNWLQSSWQGDALQVCHFVDTFSKFTLTSCGVGGGIWAGAIGEGGGQTEGSLCEAHATDFECLQSIKACLYVYRLSL